MTTVRDRTKATIFMAGFDEQVRHTVISEIKVKIAAGEKRPTLNSRIGLAWLHTTDPILFTTETVPSVRDTIKMMAELRDLWTQDEYDRCWEWFQLDKITGCHATKRHQDQDNN